MKLLFIPLIPILAFLAIGAGATTLTWYYNQSKSKQKRANLLAMKFFGKQFKLLAERERLKIEHIIDDELNKG